MYVNGEQSLDNIPSHINLGKYLLDNFRLRNHEIALENNESKEKLSYKALTQNAVNYSTYFKKLGIAKGDTVAIGSEKRIEIVQTIIAVVFTGATCTTFYSTSGRADLKHKITIAEPKHFICSKLFWTTYKDTLQSFKCIKNILTFDEEFDSIVSIKSMIAEDEDVNRFEPSEVQGRTDTALILYSSGTTGMPKGVQLTHLSCIINSLPKEYNDPTLQTAFLFGEWYHNYDVFMTFKFLSAGKKLVYVTNVTPETILQCVENCHVNIAFLIPVFISQLSKLKIDTNYNTETLKIIYSRSNPLDSKIIEKIKERFPKLQNVLQGYGMTEAGEIASEIWRKHNSKVGSVGVVSPGCMVKVVDIDSRKMLGANERGEICIKSPAFMKGYIGFDSSIYLDEEGFYKTGDLGYYDEDKYFYIVDRLKELIVSEGHKFPPIQLETLLLLHPSVYDAGVVGKPDSDYGEVPTAFIVKQHGSNVTELDLLDYVAAEVPQHMQLRGGIIFIEKIPRSPRGKILRRHLRDILQQFCKQ